MPGGVAKTLHDGGHGDVGFLPTFRGTRHTDLGHSSADRDRAVDEGCTSGGARLLAVIVGEENTFIGNAVNVGRLVAHHAAIVVADVFSTDVIAPDYEDVRLYLLCNQRTGARNNHCDKNRNRKKCLHQGAFQSGREKRCLP